MVAISTIRRKIMGLVKKLGTTGVIAAALAELQKERVKEATGKLKELYDRRDKSKKIYRNVCREIDDYLEDLEIDDDDAGSSVD
jgi:t-SNARE complex subunit (syntaxin)